MQKENFINELRKVRFLKRGIHKLWLEAQLAGTLGFVDDRKFF
jgi:hypothetical protein